MRCDCVKERVTDAGNSEGSLETFLLTKISLLVQVALASHAGCEGCASWHQKYDPGPELLGGSVYTRFAIC